MDGENQARRNRERTSEMYRKGSLGCYKEENEFEMACIALMECRITGGRSSTGRTWKALRAGLEIKECIALGMTLGIVRSF